MSELRITTHGGGGYRMVMRGEASVCSESDTDLAIEARYALRIRESHLYESVAVIGGGFCILPRLLGSALDIDIYEIVPELERFRPWHAAFIPGDWRDTLRGTYDVIVYDIGDLSREDRERLTSHLNPGGLLLPLEK